MRYHGGVSARGRNASPEFAIPLLLEKIATSLALPLGTVFVLGMAALLALVRKRHRLGGALLAVALLWLWMCSTPLAGVLLTGPLVGQFPPQRIEDLPSADAIVVLSGAVLPATDSRPFTHIHTTADRTWHAARLFHAGKAPIVVASGGTVRPVPDPTGAASMGELLEALGVPNEAIVLEEESRNTRQNAIHTARVATERGIRTVLLVTSPWHMPRAIATFRAAGLPATPAPSAYARGPFGGGLLVFMPSTTALSTNTKAMRELLAQLVYRWRGWV